MQGTISKLMAACHREWPTGNTYSRFHPQRNQQDKLLSDQPQGVTTKRVIPGFTH